MADALSRAVSVATTATRLDSGTGSADGVSGSTCTVRNNGAATIYLGGSDVTTANGFPLKVDESFAWDLGTGEELYGIVASSTVEARVIEGGVG